MADYKELGTVSVLTKFDIELADVSQQFVRKHEPFDEQCARLDFRDKLESLERESERRNGFIKVDDIKLEHGNLDRYGDIDRFELLSKEDTFGDKLTTDGKKTQGMIGYTMNYKCKQRGHGISVFVPLEGKKLVEHNEKKRVTKE